MDAVWHDRRTGQDTPCRVIGEERLNGLKRYRIAYRSAMPGAVDGMASVTRTVLASDVKIGGTAVNGAARGLPLDVVARARKVKALHDRGSTQGEKDAAYDRLRVIGAAHGLTADQLLAVL